MAEACSELDEGAKLEEATTCLRDKLLINFLFHRDLRVSETLSLRPEDIDFKAGTISILNLQSRISRYCPQCDARLRKSDNFCPKCGEKVAEAVTSKQEQRRVRTILMDKET